MRFRVWITGSVMCGSLLAIALVNAQMRVPQHSQEPAKRANTAPSDPYAMEIRPLIKKYCLACHSTISHRADLDLERFKQVESVRSDLKPWQSVLDHLRIGDMPPNGSPQPSSLQKNQIVSWVRALLKVEARATAGDPGYVPLRRLSNAEYDCTIRDLTGVDLQPTREFPADGAAGEGFTNAAESLTDISPTLLAKYFAAAKEISEHTVLLPDGLRFSPGKTRRDWTDESTARLRAFYLEWTGADGRLNPAPYLLATVRYKADLLSGKISIKSAAEHDKLNPKYLQILWNALSSSAPSQPLDEIRSVWRHCSESDVPQLAANVAAVQSALWQVARVGSYVRPVAGGYSESTGRQVPLDPMPSDSQPIKLAVKPLPGQSDVELKLDSHELDTGPAGQVEFHNPRFEGPGKETLLLRDYAKFAVNFEVDYPSAFADTASYLAATIDAVNSPSPLAAEIAKKRGLNSELLGRWVDLLNLDPYSGDSTREFPGRPIPAAVLQLLDEPVRNSNNLPAINGWRGKGAELPIAVTNSSSQVELIPGTASPHSVMVHPTPTEFVAAAWTSPVTGSVQVKASIVHAHASCGNGIAWWLEHRRGERAAVWDEGRIDLGGSANPLERSLYVEKGDVIVLAVDAKDGDHACDLTRIGLTISRKQAPDEVWDLAGDVANTVLEGNPHADRHGNRAVWSFVKGPTRSVSSGVTAPIPPNSILGLWRAAASDPARRTDALRLANLTTALLSGPRPAANGANAYAPADADANRRLYDLLVTPESPLFQGANLALLPKPKSGGVQFGLPASRFSGTSVVVPANSVLTIRLPAALLSGRAFAAEGRLDAPSPTRAVVFHASATTIGQDAPVGLSGSGPVVASRESAAFKQIVEGDNLFRACFPLFLCYPSVIPIDEVVNLKMFHREDEPLKRLFLNDDQAGRLDRLWNEHLFISRQAAAENRYLPLFIGFVTQDQPKEMVNFFEGQRPAFQRRADAFEKAELAAIPKQLDALSDFASRAYRRPLSAAERAAELALYNSVRAKGAPHDEAMRAVIGRLLVSPEFLFRMEQPPVGRNAAPVNEWELATRLSYFLWSSTPDDELRRLAAAGQLHKPGVLAQQMRRMLQDKRVRALAVEFGAQWIHVRGFDAVNEKNERLFPTFDASLRKAIYEETVLFFQDLFQRDRPASNILNADYTYLNEQLARHYGIPGVSGPEWRRVDHIRQFGRGGVLGLASVQASESGASRTSPVLRGNWVSETLLGEKLPRPPPNVPKLPELEGSDGLTLRQQVEKHSKNPACAVCHQRMDPFGFSMERYDTIGRFRDRDLGGLAVDDRATLKDGTRFKGIDGLRTYLLTKRGDQVMRLFCRRLLGYALGRSVINSDQPLIDQMVVEINKNHGLSSVLTQVVASQQFRMRRPQ